MWPAYKGEGGGKLNASAKRDRFLSDTFQASIVSFFGNILFNSTL